MRYRYVHCPSDLDASVFSRSPLGSPDGDELFRGLFTLSLVFLFPFSWFPVDATSLLHVYHLPCPLAPTLARRRHHRPSIQSSHTSMHHATTNRLAPTNIHNLKFPISLISIFLLSVSYIILLFLVIFSFLSRSSFCPSNSIHYTL